MATRSTPPLVLKFNATIEGAEKVHEFVKVLSGLSEFYSGETMILTLSDDSLYLFRGSENLLQTSMVELWVNTKECFDHYDFKESGRGQISFELEGSQLYYAMKGIVGRVEILKLRIVQVDSHLQLRIKIPNLNVTHDLDIDLRMLNDTYEYRIPNDDRDSVSVQIPEAQRFASILMGFKKNNHTTMEITVDVPKCELTLAGHDNGTRTNLTMSELNVTSHVGRSGGADLRDVVNVKVSTHNLHQLYKNIMGPDESIEIKVVNGNCARFMLQKSDCLFTIYLAHTE